MSSNKANAPKAKGGGGEGKPTRSSGAAGQQTMAASTALLAACRVGDFATARRALAELKATHTISVANADATAAFGVCCELGHLNIATWLLDNEVEHDDDDGGNDVRVVSVYYNVDVHAQHDGAFRSACKNGHLEVARWLHQDVGGVNVHSYHDQAFRWACRNGHLEVARWLHEDVGGVDVHAFVDDAFRLACCHGNFVIAQWLYVHVGGVDVHFEHDRAFRWACANGHLNVAKWLYEDVGGVDVHAYDDDAFQSACGHAHLGVARWLHDVVGGVDVHAQDDDAFRYACRKEHPEVALWLDSDDVWCGTRTKPTQCVEYVQSVRWSDLRQQWIGMVACFCHVHIPRQTQTGTALPRATDKSIVGVGLPAVEYGV